MVSILKYLRSQGGWITGAMMLGSMVMNGVMGSQKNKALGASGVEFANRDYVDKLEQERLAMASQHAGENQQVQDIRGAASPGLMSALPEVFSMKPNSSELDAVAAQQKNLQNNALNSGARGGLLKQQMFEAAKNAATNKLGIMENARQNALQRAMSVFGNAAPTNVSNVAGQQLDLQGRQLGSSNSQFDVNTELRRKLPQAAADQQSAAGSGGGLGSILGMVSPMLSGLFGGGGGGGAITNAVGGTPTFSMGGGFSNIFV